MVAVCVVILHKHLFDHQLNKQTMMMVRVAKARGSFLHIGSQNQLGRSRTYAKRGMPEFCYDSFDLFEHLEIFVTDIFLVHRAPFSDSTRKI